MSYNKKKKGEIKMFYLDNESMDVLNALVSECETLSDGHLTLMKFTTNYRASFSTPTSREDIEKMSVGYTKEEAILGAIYWTLKEAPEEKRDKSMI